MNRLHPVFGPGEDRNAPAAADIRDTDRIEYEGVTYDIDGSVERWPSPTGRLAHIEARLVRTEG